MNVSKMFTEYAEVLKCLPKVTGVYREESEKSVWIFKSDEPNALRVKLYHWHKGGNFVGIDVEGVDCAYWHTAEEGSLDYHIQLASAALGGDVQRSRSPVLRREEVCFKIGDAWECTLTDRAGSFHYIKTRKSLRKS